MSAIILHITDQLGIGGAEVLLKNTVPRLSEFNHVIVHLGGPEALKDCFSPWPVYNLGHKGKKHIPRSIRRLRRIIRRHGIDIIHAHLYWSSVIARLAKPRGVRVITTIHSVLSEDAFRKSRSALWLERLIADRQDDVIAVSATVLEDYMKHVSYKGRKHVVYNYIPITFIKNGSEYREDEWKQRPLKGIAVGNLKEAKNYEFVMEAMSLIEPGLFELDIAGEGSLRNALQEKINKKNLPVRLLGNQAHLEDLLGKYTIFLQASKYEGFGIALAEAVASGLIPLLSDIAAHHEVSGDHAFFFKLDDPSELANLLNYFARQPFPASIVASARAHILHITAEDRYFTNLRRIYALQ